jgi:hypothetical protein
LRRSGLLSLIRSVRPHLLYALARPFARDTNSLE